MEKKNPHLVQVLRKNDSEIEPHELAMTHGVSLLEGLLTAKLEIDHSCGGYGTCGTCLVHVLSSSQALQPRNELEAEMALDRGFQPDERLSCQTEVVCDLKIFIQ